jgi:hypothetical protein
MRGPAKTAVWLIPATTFACCGTAVGLTVESPAGRRDPLAEVVLVAAMLATWAALGALIIRRHPRHVVGWLVVGVGVAGSIGIAGDA